MIEEKIPKIGLWYETDDGQTFEVVAKDESEGIIKLQYIDGETNEINMQAWYDIDMHEVISPGDWHSHLDDFV